MLETHFKTFSPYASLQTTRQFDHLLRPRYALRKIDHKAYKLPSYASCHRPLCISLSAMLYLLHVSGLALSLCRLKFLFILEQLLNEVDVRHNHSSTAVSVES